MIRSYSEDQYGNVSSLQAKRPQSLDMCSLEKNIFVAINNYTSEDHGISLVTGDVLQVDMEKGGWAYILHLGKTTGASEGWVPRNCLEKQSRDGKPHTVA